MADTVLVVDDTPSKRYVLASWLRRGGYVVEEAATGTEALARFGAGGIDLVLLDVRLPDLDGFEVCERIKAHPVHGTTPVIHVSAAAVHSVDRTHGLSRGADAYLVEPINPDEMLATVASILRYYQARIVAEQLAGRLTNLARVTAAMGATTTHLGLLREAAAGAALIFNAPAAIVATDADGSRRAAVCQAPGHPVEIRSAVLDLGESTVGLKVVDLAPDRWPASPFLPGEPVRHLTVRARTESPPLHVLVPTDAALDGTSVLSLFGQAAMSAMDSMRLYEEEHDVALTLQRSLLPRRLPHIPGFEVAVRYLPASEFAEIGGDFYEVTLLGDDLLIAVGDIGGHSLHAATVMGEVRHATRAYLAEGHAPAAVLDRLNSLMGRLIPGETATMCLIAVDVTTGRVRLANAGHPPPLIRSGGQVRAIAGRSPLLGIPARPAVDVDFELGAGDLLVLYTDGLIETHGEIFDESLDRLVRAVAPAEDDLEELASRILAEVGPAARRDDIAMVVLRRSQ